MSKEEKSKLEEQEVVEQVEEIEEQYRILKDEEEKEEKRKIFLLLALFFLVFSISFAGASFSYITYKNAINRKNNEEIKNSTTSDEENPENLKNKKMEVLFTSGAEFIAEDVIPGWESVSSKEFYVKNTGDLDAQYSIKFIDIENEFEDLKDLKYTLVCNGEDVIKDGDLPTTDTIILPGAVVKAGETNTYEIYFKYLDTGVSQNKDADKTYKLSVDVTNEEK